MAEKVYLVVYHEEIFNNRTKIDDSYKEALTVFANIDDARSWIEKQARECHPNMNFEWSPLGEYAFWWRSDNDQIILATRYYTEELDFYK